ncbi:MAG: FtsX-like permease family protein [Planctomycetes bacterium]|nr:FtsX-like permease family protein [Planctomycetota bacterium]
MNERTPLALKNLTHRPRRLLVAVGGVGFAVLLIFMELGFLAALLDSTTAVIRRIRADLFILNRSTSALVARARFPRQRIEQARAGGDVRVIPIHIENAVAVLRPARDKGYPIRVLAFDPRQPLFDLPGVESAASELLGPDTAAYDTTSKAEYRFPGPTEPPGDFTGELSGRRIRLVGRFALSTDFATTGTLIMSDQNFARYFPWGAGGEDPLSVVDIGAVQVGPGASVPEVRARLERLLPNDVKVLDKAEYERNERAFWLLNTPIGYIFVAGTIIGFVVGVIICYQIIYASLDDHMGEFATLKAIGYGRSYFVGLVACQSLYLSLFGFVPGALASMFLYAGIAKATGLMVVFRPWVAAVVLGSTLLMCTVSGILAMRRLLAADPASLF